MTEESKMCLEEAFQTCESAFSPTHNQSPKEEIPEATTSKPEFRAHKFSRLIKQYPKDELKLYHEGNSNLGSGSFGNVRKYLYKDLIFAIKEFIIKGDDDKISKIWSLVIHEANILCRFRHENIVKVLGITQWPNALGIIMEYIDGGNLQNLLYDYNQAELSWNARMKIAREISAGLDYIHNYGEKKTFSHGDLKPENILLTKELQVKLADFGSAAFYRATGASSTTIDEISSKQFTLCYVAPEFLEDTNLVKNPAMDMYSFGMVLYEMISGKPPFSDCSMPMHVVMLIIAKRKPSIKLIEAVQSQLETEKHRSDFRLLKNVMERCWNNDPALRPSSKIVKEELGSYFEKKADKFSVRIKQYPNDEFTAHSKEHNLIGDGGYSEVRIYNHNDKTVAIKELVMKGGDETITKSWNMVLLEANILCRLHHENVVKILGITQWPNVVGIIMEYVDGGNLQNLLHKYTQSELSWNTRLQIAKGIVSGLDYIHDYGEKKTICHGDLKSKNVLLTKKLQVKLSDFGSAAFLRATGASTSTVNYISTTQFSLIYVAPEFLEDVTRRKNPAMDMYSFGMVLYELISKKTPYSDCSMPHFLVGIIAAKIKPTLKFIDDTESQLKSDDDRTVFNSLKNLMERCWNNDPASRPRSKTAKMDLSRSLSSVSTTAKPMELQQGSSSPAHMIDEVDAEAAANKIESPSDSVPSLSHDQPSKEEFSPGVTKKPDVQGVKFSSRIIQYPNVELKLFEDDSVIGCGIFGRVRKYHHNDKTVAIKEFSIIGDDETLSNIWNMVQHEANILCHFNHENIVEIQGITQWPSVIGIIMEYIDGGNLQKLLSADKQSKLSWKNRLDIANGIASGLEYIHNYDETKTFCHGDLQPKNVLLTQLLQVKLADFGSAALYYATATSTTTISHVSRTQFTLIYVAPEILECNTRERNPTMDMYSYGMVLYELISRRAPYSDTAMPMYVPAIIMAKVKPSDKLIDDAESQLETDDDRATFSFLKKLMQRCWNNNPDLRPSSKTVKIELRSFSKDQSQGFIRRKYGNQKTGVKTAATDRENVSVKKTAERTLNKSTSTTSGRPYLFGEDISGNKNAESSTSRSSTTESKLEFDKPSTSNDSVVANKNEKENTPALSKTESVHEADKEYKSIPAHKTTEGSTTRSSTTESVLYDGKPSESSGPIPSIKNEDHFPISSFAPEVESDKLPESTGIAWKQKTSKEGDCGKATLERVSKSPAIASSQQSFRGKEMLEESEPTLTRQNVNKTTTKLSDPRSIFEVITSSRFIGVVLLQELSEKSFDESVLEKVLRLLSIVSLKQRLSGKATPEEIFKKLGSVLNIQNVNNTAPRLFKSAPQSLFVVSKVSESSDQSIFQGL